MKRKPILIAQEAAVSLAQKTAPQASRWGAAPTPTFAERAEMEQIDSFGAAGGSEALSRPHQAGGLFVVQPALQVQGYQAAEPSPILGGAPTRNATGGGGARCLPLQRPASRQSCRFLAP